MNLMTMENTLEIFMFKDEYSVRKKIKVQCIEKDTTDITA